MIKPIVHPSRTAVRGFSCPACGAAPGAPCLGRRGKLRESNHQERVEAYVKANPERRHW